MSDHVDPIHFREKLLFRILGISPNDVLNDKRDIKPTKEDRTLIYHLKQTANNIRAQAISQNGNAVNYADLATSEIYLDFQKTVSPRLRYFDPSILMQRAERLAFWINLYNILVIDGVIRYDIQSGVTEGFLGILRFFRRAAYNIGGFRTSLEDIEHGILRENKGNPFIPGAQFAEKDPRNDWIITPMDPRIHFALNCASKSCPPTSIYTPEHIDRQLDSAARNFISQESNFDAETKTLRLSRIFQWFATDFGGKAGVLDFFQSHLADADVNMISSNRESLRIAYNRYDWGLNIQA